MNLIKTIILILIFISTLSLGAIVGVNFSQAPDETISFDFSNPQQNILLVSVDQLDNESPTIQSIWLLLFVPPTPRITFVPIYPTETLGSETYRHILKGSFYLNQDETLSAHFTQVLNEMDISWNNYLIFDNYWLEMFAKFAGSDTFGSALVNSETINTTMSIGNPDTKTTQSRQASLYQLLCSNLATTFNQYNSFDIQELLSINVITDIETSQVTDNWQEFLATGIPLTCTFPTLEQK